MLTRKRIKRKNYNTRAKYTQDTVRMDPLNVLAKFEVHSFTRSRDNSDWSFGWGANPNLGKGRP